MNLHEECLLKYLTNPSELTDSTDTLKLINKILSKGIFDEKYLMNRVSMEYTAV